MHVVLSTTGFSVGRAPEKTTQAEASINDEQEHAIGALTSMCITVQCGFGLAIMALSFVGQ